MANIVSRDTAHRIWVAHREIETSEKLLAELRETIARDAAATPVDWDRRWHLQLGVPSGSGHRLFDVAPHLAIAVIEAHIASQQRDLAEASIVARTEAEA